MFGAKRMILISDSMRATGLNDGDYTLGGQPVKVKGNLATLHDGTIAGSATNLMDCVRFVVKKSAFRLKQQSCAHLKIRQKKSEFSMRSEVSPLVRKQIFCF